MKQLIFIILVFLPVFAQALDVKVVSAKIQDSKYKASKTLKENADLKAKLISVLERKGYVVIENAEIAVTLTVSLDEGAIINFDKFSIQKKAKPLIKEDNYYLMMFFTDRESVTDQNERLMKRSLRKLFRAIPEASKM